MARSEWGILDPKHLGKLPVSQTGVMSIKTVSGAETNTLAAPSRVGLAMLLVLDTNAGTSRVITLSPTGMKSGAAGALTTLTLNLVGEFAQLVSITQAGALRWLCIAASTGVEA